MRTQLKQFSTLYTLSPPHGLKFSTQMISVLASSFSLFKKKHNHFFPVSNISVRFQSFLSIVNIIFVLFAEEEGVYVLIGVSGRKILILLTSSEHSFYTTCCHLHRMYLWVLSSRSPYFPDAAYARSLGVGTAALAFTCTTQHVSR